MENLEAVEGRFVLSGYSSTVRIHDSTSRDSNTGLISFARERLATRLLSRYATVLMSNYLSEILT